MEIQKVFTDYSGERLYSVRLSESELISYQKEFGMISGLKKGWGKLSSRVKKLLKREEKKVVDQGKAVIEDGAKKGAKEVEQKVAKEAQIAEKTKQAEQQAKQTEETVVKAQREEGKPEFIRKHWKALSAGTAGLGGAYLLLGDRKPKRRYNDYEYYETDNWD